MLGARGKIGKKARDIQKKNEKIKHVICYDKQRKQIDGSPLFILFVRCPAVQGGLSANSRVQIAFMAGDRAVNRHLLHEPPSLVIVAAFHDCRAVPAGETRRAVGRVVRHRPDAR